MPEVDVKKCAALMEAIEGFSTRYVECMATKELNGIQALMLMRLGGREETIGSLSDHYFGTNISYNVKKLVDAGYIVRKDSKNDRRIGLVSLTGKGIRVWTELSQRHQKFSSLASDDRVTALSDAIRSLRVELESEGYPVRGVR